MLRFLLGAAIAISSITIANAWYHPVVPVVAKPVAAGPAGGSGALCAGGCPWVAGFIGVVAAAIVVHEVMGPKCASNSKANKAKGYDQPALWRPLCNWKSAAPAKPIKVRG